MLPYILSLTGQITQSGGSSAEQPKKVGGSHLLVCGGSIAIKNAFGVIPKEEVQDEIQVTALRIGDTAIQSDSVPLREIATWLGNPNFQRFVVPNTLELKYAYQHTTSSLTDVLDFPYTITIALFCKQLSDEQYRYIVSLEKGLSGIGGLVGLSDNNNDGVFKEIAGAVRGLNEVATAFHALLGGNRNNGHQQLPNNQYNQYR